MRDSGDEIEFIVNSVGADAGDFDYDFDDLATDPDDGPEVDLFEFAAPAEDDKVAKALTPGTPLFLIHRSHQHASILPQVVEDIHSECGGSISLGVAASMPRMHPTRLEQFLKASNVPVRIADPECFARTDSFGPTLSSQRDGKPLVGKSTEKHWDYFSAEQPDGQTESWVGQVLDAQREAGATVLLTPGMWADPSSPIDSLANARQHAEWARSTLAPNEHMAVNITVPPTWLTTPRLRERLLNEIVDMDESVFYIRVRWPLLAQTYGQLIDQSILDGYVELSNVFEENEKSVILPNTGLTGWLSLAWGAHGFSTGLGSGERAFADTRVIKIKRDGPAPTPAQRVFAKPILHVIERSVSDRLNALPGTQGCDCRFCKSLRQLPPGQFDKPLAGAHYLRTVAALTADLANGASNRRVAARRIVRGARNFRQTASQTVPFTGANDPRHLPLWGDLLR